LRVDNEIQHGLTAAVDEDWL